MGSISILDIGLGNIASIKRMIEKIGGECKFVSKPTQIADAKKIILPGVGHYDEGMRSLNATGFTEILIQKSIKEDSLLLGICLGMQLLCKSSEEGNLPGLGLIDAEVKKFTFPPEKKFKIPHMGWNIVHPDRTNPLLPQDSDEQRFYFVHSYKVVPNDPAITIGTADYGGEFCASFQMDNIYGVQFHPEKSHRFGMALLKRFIEL